MQQQAPAFTSNQNLAGGASAAPAASDRGRRGAGEAGRRHHRQLAGAAALLLAGVTARCAQPACEREPLGCSVPMVTIAGTPRLSLTRDVTLQLSIKKQFSTSPTALRVQQVTSGQRAELAIRLQCPDLSSCAVTVASADLKTSNFLPGEAQLAVLDAPDSTEPLVSSAQTLRIDDPQFVFVPDGGDAGLGWPLPDVAPGSQNLGLRWMSAVPTVGNAQGILARAALDSGNYEVNSLYIAAYNAISHDFTLTPRANGIIGKSAFYSDASYLWHMTRVNGATESYNLSKIDLRNINGPDVTLRIKTLLTGPPTLLAVTPDGVSAAIADETQAVSHFSTGGAEAPGPVTGDGRPVVALQAFQLISAPQLAVVNPDRVRLFDVVAYQALPAGNALSGLPGPGAISTLAASDLNGDGLTDLLVANGLTLAIWAQRADRTFAAVNYLQLPAVNAPCPENPDLKLVRTVRGLASGELDGAPGVDLLVATEDTCEQTGTPQTARLFVFLHGS